MFLESPVNLSETWVMRKKKSHKIHYAECSSNSHNMLQNVDSENN